MSALPTLVAFAAGYCFRWLTQHLLHRIATQGKRISRPAFDEARFQKEGNYLLPKMQNPSPPPPRKGTSETRIAQAVSAATLVDWSLIEPTDIIMSWDGGKTWMVRYKSGKFASVNIEGLSKKTSVEHDTN
jgi:hypothetical protein